MDRQGRRPPRGARLWRGGVVLLVLGGACVGRCAVQAANVARMPGVLVVADSEHRDRWGVDGFHADFVRDGATEAGVARALWVSDNWEVTHTVTLVFPQRVRIARVVVYWGRPGTEPLTPRRFSLHAWRGAAWVELADLRPPAPEPVTTIEFAATEAEALRLTQLPDGAAAGADRRLYVAEIEVTGEPLEPAVAVEGPGLAGRLWEGTRALRQREDQERVAPALAGVMQQPKRTGLSGVIDRADLERGRANAATRGWARALAESIIRDADWWVARSDEYLWGLIPEGNPRAICPSFELGDPIHGGARLSFAATLEAPYRWRSKQGGEEWYDGAVIVNPGTGEPVTVRDDGRGWVAPEGFLHPGRRYYFVAAYRYYLLGKLFSSPYEPDGGSEYQGGTPVTQLALAYALTGDRRYAHKCAVLLNRLAELYRTYDGCVEGPSQRQDGYIGQTFERFVVQNLILACDLIWDEVESDTELQVFFASRGDTDYNGDGVRNGADFTHNLQRNLLGHIYEYLHRLMPYFDGDFLMYELTALSALAHTLGNPAIAAEALESDTGLRVLLGNSWFRDGKFIYDSTGYNVGNAQTPLWIAELLHGLVAPPRYAEPVDVYNHAEHRMSMLYDFLRHVDCDGRVPPIGDGGGPRTNSLETRPAYHAYDERAVLRIPAQREYYAALLQAAAGGDLEAFRSSRADWWLLFHAEPPAATPLTAAAPVARTTSHVFDDSGIAILRAGGRPETREHVCLTFSKGGYGHGHPDKLALSVLRYGYDFSADLGYPTTWTDIKAGGWETNTASHCTVMLDERPQRANVIGTLHYYATEPLCDVVEASAEGAYPQSSLYRRTVALVRDGAGEPGYVVDVFRIAGAATRDYLCHSLGRPEGLAITLDDPAAAWVRQERGSLAGEDVEPQTQGGYGFLFGVERARTDGGFAAVWRPTPAGSQPDRYLLTRQSFTDATVEFTVTRTGEAGGPRERSVFVFATDPAAVGHRRVIMLPVESLPVGQAVPVRVEVAGGEAKMTIAGAPSGRVDVAGSPGTSGSVGFLHYYDYSFEYRDLVITPAGGEPIRVDLSGPLDQEFWALADPTYDAAGGVLRARDSELVAFHLRMLGAPGREVIRAQAEGYGVRGQSPLEGHVIVRERAAQSEPSAFVAVVEAVREQPLVRALRPLAVTPLGAAGLPPAATVALQVGFVQPDGQLRRDVVISSTQPDMPCRVEGAPVPVTFQGRFAVVRTRDGQVTSLTLVGGGSLVAGDRRLDQPGSFRGHIVEALVVEQALLVRPEDGSAPPGPELVNRRLLVRNPAFVCPAVYTVESVEQGGPGLWRLGLNMPLIVARGVVGGLDLARGSFASRTPVMKLRVNPGLFDGKCARRAAEGPEYRLATATEGSFQLVDPDRIADFAEGADYVVCDVGAGDGVEVLSQSSAP